MSSLTPRHERRASPGERRCRIDREMRPTVVACSTGAQRCCCWPRTSSPRPGGRCARRRHWRQPPCASPRTGTGGRPGPRSHEPTRSTTGLTPAGTWRGCARPCASTGSAEVRVHATGRPAPGEAASPTPRNVSVRTVESHVSHILAKLGMRSRVDIVRGGAQHVDGVPRRSAAD
ncbi:LuxR C-terminal-related transcriptional regulator [Actinophytocola sp. KF-1]